ncbi:MAG: flagellin [Terriglobales bacterium]
MALSILNNIASLAAQNQLSITNANLQKALFQLSSGSRINSGADDAAGLAIADGLHANITALTQSARNANDGVGELQVADGSLAQVTTMLNRAVTLATEAATGTVSDAQRVALDAEYTAIKAEIDRVGLKTNYNGGQVFTANTLNVFLSDAGATSNSTIAVTTGLLSSTGLSLGGAVAATGTLTQAAGAPAVAASDILTGGVFAKSVAANTVLTKVGTGPAATDTVAIGGTTYTFVALAANLTGAANEVVIGGSTTQAYLNLQAAVNGTPGGAGIAYGVGTVANANVNASGATATTLNFTANLNGTGGNAITSVSSAVGDETFTAGVLANGANGDTVAVGGKTYTFVTALSATPTANEVVWGTTEATALANLVSAVNAGTGSGTTYSTPTTQNANVSAVATPLFVGTKDTFTATTAGAAGNFLTGAVTTAGAAAFASLDFTGGVNAGTPPPAVAGNTVTVGTQTYTFVTALSTTPTANEVLVGATEAASLANLANAINGGSGSGATYGSPTVANASATAAVSTTGTLSTLTLTAITKGLTGNSIATTETGTANTFGGTLLTGGTAGSVNDLLNITDATAALATINSAIQQVAGLRGTIGATVNRLQSASTVITNQVQNLTGAEDGVRAADIPSTVATLAKYSILEQTGISALAQANQQQQLVLKLLQ